MIEVIMRELWKMSPKFTVRVDFGDGVWIDLDVTVRLIASDNVRNC